MEGILKVTPEQLTSTANSFSATGTQVRNLTAAMTDLVNGMASIWTGEAASAYTTKFNGLQDDISKINAMIQEHVNDLTQMASTYNSAEQASTSEAQGLSSDVIV
jgi:WXG100 family type VII secretion target